MKIKIHQYEDNIMIHYSYGVVTTRCPHWKSGKLKRANGYTDKRKTHMHIRTIILCTDNKYSIPRSTILLLGTIFSWPKLTLVH